MPMLKPLVQSKVKGFTLIELMVALAIMLILVSMGAPSLRSFIVEGSVKQASSDLLTDFYVARSASGKLNCDVTVTAVNASDWSKGWSVSYMSTSASDLTCAATGGVLVSLKKHAALTGINVVSTPAVLTSAIYGFDGRLASSVSFNISPTILNQLVHMRCVSINASGRPSVKVDRDYDITNGC